MGKQHCLCTENTNSVYKTHHSQSYLCDCPNSHSQSYLYDCHQHLESTLESMIALDAIQGKKHAQIVIHLHRKWLYTFVYYLYLWAWNVVCFLSRILGILFLITKQKKTKCNCFSKHTLYIHMFVYVLKKYSLFQCMYYTCILIYVCMYTCNANAHEQCKF